MGFWDKVTNLMGQGYANQSASLTAGYRANNPNGTVAKATDNMLNEYVVKSNRIPVTEQPLSKQNKDPFGSEILRFPTNIGSDGGASASTPKLLHWIKFTPCVQQKSSYDVKVTNQLSVADTNRSGIADAAGNPIGAGYGAGSINPMQGGAFATAGTGVKGAVSAGIKLLEDGPGAAIKTGVIGAGETLVTGLVVDKINLTRKTRRAQAYICLYMPDTVNQQLVNDYDQTSLTQALGTAGLLGAVGGSIGTTLGNLSEGKGFGAGLGATLAESVGALAEKTGSFGAGISDLLLFSAGVAQNPQVELLFKSIQNREFLFDFRFVPKNAAEAKTIRDIIKKFRFHAAPEIPEAGRGRYFIPPSEFDIQFMIGDSLNPALPRISTCVLEGIDINYGSAGQWTAFADGHPVEISMQLRFKETEIMHKKLIAEGY